MLTHDIIKINYTRSGYLPNFPYHLISDEEMFEGFMSYTQYEETLSSYTVSADGILYVLKSMPTQCVVDIQIDQQGNLVDPTKYVFSQLKNTLVIQPDAIDRNIPIHVAYTALSDDCYMSDTYPYLHDTLYVYYRALLLSMKYHIDIYISIEKYGEKAPNVYYTDGYENITLDDYLTLSMEDRSDWTLGYKIPDWVYSYMLGTVTGPYSDDADIHDLFALFDNDTKYVEFNADICNYIYTVSSNWLMKVEVEDSEHRPPTYFGEPHVWKSLRLQQENPLFNEET